MWLWRIVRRMTHTYVIGNGETRLSFDLNLLKEKGIIYGCNAIYRDHPDLCDYIMAVNDDMYAEILDAKRSYKNVKATLLNKEDLPDWNYLCKGDNHDHDKHRKPLMRFWTGGDARTGKTRTIDFTETRGSGCSAVLHAVENGAKSVAILGFDFLGARQWEASVGEMMRPQNNVYKNTPNYPSRINMKAYLKYEWLFHLRQTARKYNDVKFYYFNRKEYIKTNPLLFKFFDVTNIYCGTYADLLRFTRGEEKDITWRTFHGGQYKWH